MSDMMLNLSLVPVGPRETFVAAAGQKWRFALQVAVSFTEPGPQDHERLAWARAMLPWIALDHDHVPVRIAWRLFPSSGGITIDGDSRAETEGAISLPIRDRLQQQFWDRFTHDKPASSFVV